MERLASADWTCRAFHAGNLSPVCLGALLSRDSFELCHYWRWCASDERAEVAARFFAWAVAYVVVLSSFITVPRYDLLAMPLVMLFAAAAVSSLARMSGQRMRHVGALAVCSLPCSWLRA